MAEQNPLTLGKVNLTVKSSSKVFYQGEVAAISFTNSLGPFDILPGHENMIAMVDNQVTIYLDDKRKMAIPISRGVVKVASNTVIVFVGI